MAKELPCCARVIGKLHHDQNNLRTLARKAAAAEQRGLSIERFKKLMDQSKEAIEDDKAMIASHEAEHAA